ncbi:hypothetical protein Dda_1696 [Drechslerella dactyloides]|uniref:Uncharacterized protein n=1 Tax=Drechslerella dactyloides TaxID=74499 RepID=A0AAD6J2Y6_DREDA|nr:hypothetical protein Dda_1696 [Drechslerella dactyloides]
MRVGILSAVIRTGLLVSSLLTLGVSGQVVSNVDQFNVILKSKEDAALWVKLVKDIKAIQDLWLVDKATMRVDGVKYPGGKAPEIFDDYASVALSIVEEVRRLLEPTDDDTVGLELALEILARPPFNIETAHHAVSILDTLTGYLLNIPTWIETIVSGSIGIDDFNTNPYASIFWLFGGSLRMSSTSAKPRVAWDPERPSFIRRLFLVLKLELDWATEEFEAQQPMLEALAPEFGVEGARAFNSLVLWTGHYAQLVKRVSDDLYAIRKSESFRAVYKNTGAALPADLRKYFQKHLQLPARARQTSLVAGLNELRAAEVMRTEGETIDSSPRAP